jgi:acyl-coenzyme A thioesterase PaaI-like protein
MDITKLPFNEFIGLERSSDEGFVFRLPAGVRYTNHLGTVHASALMAIAEATSGELLLRAIGDTSTDVIPVVRRFESKFRKAATGSIRSKGAISTDAIAAFMSTLRSRGRATMDIPVELYDESAACVLSASVEWFVATRTAAPNETLRE